MTGSQGYLGSQVCAELSKVGIEATTLDLSGSSLIADIRSADQLKRLAIDRGSLDVVHLAGNLPGTVKGGKVLPHSLAMARNVLEVLSPPRLLFLSSTAVYPLVQTGPALEPDPWEIYGQSKLQTEQLIRDTADEWTIFRAGTLIDHRRSGGIRSIMKRAIAGKTTPLPSRGRVVHPFVATPDVCQAIVQWVLDASSFQNQVIDLVAETPRQLVDLISQASQGPTRIIELPKIARRIGSDSFPILGISRWHLMALAYDLHSFSNQHAKLRFTSMSESFSSSFA